MSTVGIGDADQDLLTAMAELGQGESYFTNDFGSLPQIFSKETLRASKSMLVEEPFVPSVTETTDQLLKGVELADAPLLMGYVSTTPKEAARLLLVSDYGDPILAKWNYGLGRSVAFTSDAKNRWATDWVSWSHFGKFWGQVVRSVMSTGTTHALQQAADIRLHKGEVRVAIDTRDREGRFLDALQPDVAIVDASGGTRGVETKHAAPGLYEGRFRLDTYGDLCSPACSHPPRRHGVSDQELRGRRVLSPRVPRRCCRSLLHGARCAIHRWLPRSRGRERVCVRGRGARPARPVAAVCAARRSASALGYRVAAPGVEEAEPSPRTLASSIPILHQDDHILVVDKPPRLLVVPAPGRSGATVVDRVQKQLGERVYAVHRLDEDTTGVLALARSLEAKKALEQVFRAHEAERVYLAVVCRAPSPLAGRIESKLRENKRGVMESVVRGHGQHAVTHYRTVRRLQRDTLVECRLETGRRNQIRAHLSELGCPVVGDRKYGYRSRGEGAPKRPMLHAWRLRFRHPIDGVEIAVEASVPDGFPEPEV